MKRVVASVALMFLIALPIAAQTGKSAFEVASVRIATPGGRSAQRVTQTRLEVVNTPLRLVLMVAFRVREFQLSAPAWVNDAYVDIQATFPADARARVPEMLQTLLAERFGLVTHVEARPIEAYELVVGRRGVTMKEVEAANEMEKDFGGQRLERTFETLDGPVRSIISPGLTRRVTPYSLYDERTTPQRTTQIDATRISMREFAEVLSTNLDRPVIDRTGLAGVYQFKIELDSNRTMMRLFGAAGVTTNARGEPLDVPTAVSTFRSVESLGLQLDERRTPFDVVVIDRIERNPKEN
jgi:uncharacterized protein (TIGR03435 family)